ncbi:delta-1-pyrroline-5-carboxylate synthase-like [Vicia villosa]|uniref:delta-1-pyrroline-5-carboxylate synthase-like n=1 Tax=Vicia villosa TaxID=3911 RepID=UPI00273C245C|nr:delta-1-pyrroline-5-carboxylate synthase-like [Vicia villosa]
MVIPSDGRLALRRLGALCELLKGLNTRGYEVTLVTSCGVGLGKKRLRYRRLANNSFSDLQNPQYELDGKACAAVGQSSLMALYDIMFSQLDVTSSQLVNDNVVSSSPTATQNVVSVLTPSHIDFKHLVDNVDVLSLSLGGSASNFF